MYFLGFFGSAVSKRAWGAWSSLRPRGVQWRGECSWSHPAPALAPWAPGWEILQGTGHTKTGEDAETS